MIPPIVDVAWVREHEDVVLADVRWYPDGRSGREAYVAGHLPGAVYLDVDADLAAPPDPDAGCRPPGSRHATGWSATTTPEA